MTGEIEADETYLHPRRRRGSPRYHEQVQDEIEMGLRPKPRRKGPYEGKAIVFGMQERDGIVKTVHVPDATTRTLHPIIRKWVDGLDARVITDQHPAYRSLGRFVKQRDIINHELGFRGRRRSHPEHP